MYKILLTNSSDIYGGGEFFVLELAKALGARGHYVRVCCRPDNLLLEKCAGSGVATLPLDFPANGQLVKYIRMVRQIIVEHHIDIVHTNGNYDRTAGAFAAWRSGAAHVTNVHSLQSIQHNLTHRIRNRFLTHRFLADGIRVKELLVRIDHIPESNIVVFYHGVNPEQMRRDQKQRSRVRAEFGCADDEVLFGNVGRLVPMKGQAYLLDAFARVCKTSARSRLVVVGDGELRPELERIAHAAGIQTKVIFTGFRDDLQALYSAFDIYVHSSVEGGGETISFAVQQALSQELPVVVTRVADVAENIREGVNGFVVPDRDAAALAEKMMILVQDGSLRQSMGAASRAYLLERFTTERMVVAVEDIYRSVRL